MNVWENILTVNPWPENGENYSFNLSNSFFILKTATKAMFFVCKWIHSELPRLSEQTQQRQTAWRNLLVQFSDMFYVSIDNSCVYIIRHVFAISVLVATGSTASQSNYNTADSGVAHCF